MEKAGLIRTFGLGMAVMLVLSNVIGSGVFKKISDMATLLPSPFLILAVYVLAGLVTVFGALCAAEAAAMYPQTGGPYVWLGKMYGERIGFLYGWGAFWLILTPTIAAVVIVFAQAVNSFLPLPALDASWEAVNISPDPNDPILPFDDIGVKMVAIAATWVLTLVNIRGVKFGGRTSTVFTLSAIAGILVIIGISLFSSKGSMANLQPPAGADAAAGSLVVAVMLAMRGAFWAYEGWIGLGYIGGEVKDPQRNLPLGLIIGILLVISLYALVNFAYLYALPQERFINLDSDEIAGVVVMEHLGGAMGKQFIALLILLSTFGCANATVLSASRIYYQMSKEGTFFRALSAVHPRFRTPHKSLVYQALWASFLIFTGSFDFLTNLLTTTSFLFYGAIALGVIVLRKKAPQLERPYRTIGYPLVPILFTLFAAAFVIISFLESPLKGILGLGLLLIGLPFYGHWKGKKTA